MIYYIILFVVILFLSSILSFILSAVITCCALFKYDLKHSTIFVFENLIKDLRKILQSLFGKM